MKDIKVSKIHTHLKNIIRQVVGSSMIAIKQCDRCHKTGHYPKNFRSCKNCFLGKVKIINK